ncbi:MAG: cobalamin B12-binding domain-containing protein [Thermacetogeniaceae bacterium]
MVDVQKIKDAVGSLNDEQVDKLIGDFLASNPTEEEALSVINACQEGMAVVGEFFDKGEYFVGDLIFAGELLSNAMDRIKPIIQGKSTKKIGTVVIGTVEGDLHDIGKNIFKSLAEAAGFDVFDLGINTPPQVFVEKVKEVEADIVGMSGVLTLATQAMKKTVDSLEEAGLRDKLKVIIGGNPVNSEVCRNVGADAFTTNAAEGVKICQGWVK